ncbi:PAS domain S-box protein [Propionivibrio limicola]|uniref:PAS domain S-box protein n=1 Tax=Propionivibrio limicola TaxID=167645 RepID=UPI0012923E2F|nr:PAS domain S-box protein [Propionivibrio limicola]
MTSQTDDRSAAHERVLSATRLHRLLNRLGWMIPLIVVVAILGVGAGFYLLQAKPLARANALAREQVVAEDVKARLASMIGQIERGLLTTQEWALEGVLAVDEPEQFNRLLIPLIGKWPIDGVWLVDDGDRALSLQKTTSGWANRLSGIPGTGRQYRWLRWIDANSLISDEWKEDDWNPREQPWYMGVMALPEMEAFWSAPEILAAGNEPTMAVSVRWRDGRTGRKWVLAFSVDLIELSRFTSQLGIGEHGQVALLTADGRVLGLPRHRAFESDDSIRKSILQQPTALGLPVLEQAFQLDMKRKLAGVNGGHHVAVVPPDESGDGKEWLVSVQPFVVHNQSFRLVTMAPTGGFAAVSMQLGAALVTVMLVIGVLAATVSRFTVVAVRRPLTGLFASIERDRMEAEHQVERRNIVAAITSRMQRALNPQELAVALLSELAPRLELGQAIFCLWDDDAEELRIAASYADGGGVIEDMPLAGGALLWQCAKDRTPTVIHDPGPDYLRIRSGLGDMVPATVVIQPVQYGGRLFAVVELAGLRDFTENDRLLLADLEPIIAMNLDILLRAERTASLLVQTNADDERNRLILAAVGDGIWGMDVEGRTTFVNRTALELLGYTEDEVVGRNMHELIHARYPDGRSFPPEECPMRLTAGDGVLRTVDSEVFWHKNGRAIPVEYSTTALHHDGQIVGVVVVFRDISGRLAAQQMMKDNEALLWQILEDSPAAAAIVTEEGRVLKCNRRQAEVLGVAPDYFETHSITEFWVHPEERAAYVEELNRTGVTRNYETRFRRADGVTIWVVVNSRWVQQGGRRLLLSWLDDVTRLKVAEESVRRSMHERAVASSPACEEVGRLEALLADSDAAAVELWDSHAERFKALLGVEAAEVSRAIHDFDFDRALRCLAEAKRAAGSVPSATPEEPT